MSGAEPPRHDPAPGVGAPADAGAVTGPDLARQALDRARANARRAAREGESGTKGAGGHQGGRPGSSGAGWGRRNGAAARGGERRSGPGPDERDPALLGDAVDGLIRSRGWELAATSASLVGRWPELVGPQLAEHVAVESFTPPSVGGVGGVLVLRATSTAWATQTRLLLPTLRRRLADELGPEAITTVTVLGPTAPAWRKGALHVRGRGPRDTWG